MVVRLFSGLEDGILEGRWRPMGVPTIYRLIEALDQSGHDVRFVFTCKDKDSNWTSEKDRVLRLKGLSTPVVVLAGMRALPRWLGRLRGYVREMRQLVAVWWISRSFSPDLIYFDRGNIYLAAMFARFSRIPTVWRVMGIPSAMNEVLTDRGLVARLTRWAYRSPFAGVVCSRDGSGGQHWMERTLSPGVPRWTMLNGVDADVDAVLDQRLVDELPIDKTMVLFVARLAEDKGCREFMAGFLAALEQEPGGLHAVVVGDGKEAAAMRMAAEAHGASANVTFSGQIPHDQVIAIHRLCDIYVSLNRMCNLTNANLEALRVGACMIMPDAQPQLAIDLDTKELIPADAAWRIASVDDIDGLTEAILRFHRSPDERRTRSQRAKAVADVLIPTWDERIALEIEIFESIIAGHGL